MVVKITAQELGKAIKRYRGEPAYTPGQEVSGKLICGAKKKNTDPCGASPVPGGTRCGRHGGNSTKAKAAATQRMAEQEAREILGHIDPAATRENPVDMTTHKVEQNIWWKLLREAENQLASWTSMALRAGVEERQVRIAEQQGNLIA
ncbi:hypothetical protein ACT3UQ_05210 [Glutamicibacter sp. AOP12-B1-11]|uniref:hypothetical protein n=1 Tax=Glutamicibacter sp. AOP12-B1-11 TaxID=3457725 RepID=UPI004034EF08